MKSRLPHLIRLGLCLAIAACGVSMVQSADIPITPSHIVPGPNAQYRYGIAGVNITAGQLIYLDTTANTWKLGDCNATAITADVDGMAANTAAAGQPLTIVTADDHLTIISGQVVANGGIYILSATPGGICPASDYTTGWRMVVVAVGKGPSMSQIRFRAEGLRNENPL